MAHVFRPKTAGSGFGIAWPHRPKWGKLAVDIADNLQCSTRETAETLEFGRAEMVVGATLVLAEFTASAGMRIQYMGRDFENRKHSIMKTAAHKSKLYSKYGKQLYVCAKNGGADPVANGSLKLLIDKAKKEQVPAHVIDKALEKASGAGGEDFVTARYEGFGPSGCSVMVDCLTDNYNRTITDVRNCFTKTGFKMGAPGAVAHLFDHLAIFQFAGESSEPVLEALLEADVDVTDIECQDNRISVFAPAAEFSKAKQALLARNPETIFETEEISFVPQGWVEIAADDLPMFDKFINMLNDCEDVQEIYHNAILPR